MSLLTMEGRQKKRDWAARRVSAPLRKDETLKTLAQVRPVPLRQPSVSALAAAFYHRVSLSMTDVKRSTRREDSYDFPADCFVDAQTAEGYTGASAVIDRTATAVVTRHLAAAA